MWHTTEISEVFNRISKEYGYEVYSDRKKCAGLCGDLLMNFENEKNIFQMLFLAGFGETLKGISLRDMAQRCFLLNMSWNRNMELRLQKRLKNLKRDLRLLIRVR